MPTPTLETITRDEFDKRLDAGNARRQQELEQAERRAARLEALIARKEVFAQRLTQMLTEIEREENEIAALEKGARPPHVSARRRSHNPPAPL